MKAHFATDRSGQALATFLESIGEKLIFTVITVTNELRAYKVFEPSGRQRTSPIAEKLAKLAAHVWRLDFS